uniref:C2H2-type domain-containing protein n=1 Tax=Anopheles culicifacies TaxID=139723 RepID=A0A182MVP5_9DIPT
MVRSRKREAQNGASKDTVETSCLLLVRSNESTDVCDGENRFQQYNIEEIQQKHVCGICWTYVDDFNNFYEQIKMIHDAEDQEEIVLEQDSIRYEDNDLNGTDSLSEEESCIFKDKPLVDECLESDPLVTQANIETIVIESIEIDETFKETPTETEMTEYMIKFEESSREHNEPESRDNFNKAFDHSSECDDETKHHTSHYTCDECNDVFSSKFLLNEHRKQHATSSLQPICAECGKS